MTAPVVVALAGPNGAGKSTAALKLLRGALSVEEFVNADLIAGGISSFHPDRVAMEAGRVMMQRLKSLARLRKDFGFETTLASRSFAPWLRSLVTEGYEFRLAFLWIPSVDMALERVRSRVRTGGHAVPEDTLRRRTVPVSATFSSCIARSPRPGGSTTTRPPPGLGGWLREAETSRCVRTRSVSGSRSR